MRVYARRAKIGKNFAWKSPKQVLLFRKSQKIYFFLRYWSESRYLSRFFTKLSNEVSSFFRFRPRNHRFWPQRSYTLNFRKNWVPKNLGQKWWKIVPRVNFLLESVRRHKNYFKYQVSAFYHLPLTKKRIFWLSVFAKKRHFRNFSKYFFLKSITSSFFKISTWKFNQEVGISRIFKRCTISFRDFGLEIGLK